MFLQAEGRFASGEYAIALSRYTDFVAAYPGSDFIADAQFRRAQCLYRLGQAEEALALFNRVSARYSSTRYRLYIPFWIGIIQYELGSFEEGISSLDRFLSAPDPSFVAKALLYKGMCLYQLGRMEESLAALRSAYKGLSTPAAEPAITAFYVSLLVKAGAFSDAANLIAGMDIDSFPREWKDRLTLSAGEAYLGAGDEEKAEESFLRLLSAGGGIANSAYLYLFSLSMRRNDEQRLSEILLSAEQALAGNIEVLREFWLRIGIESFKNGKYDLAESYLMRVWNRVVPKSMDPLVPLYLAEIAARRDRFIDGAAIIEEFMEANASGRELLLFRLAGLYLQGEDWERAASAYAAFTTEFPESAKITEATYLLAYTQYRAGRILESLGTAERGIAGDMGRNLDRMLRLSSILYRKTGSVEQASRNLRRYLSFHPDDLPARVDLLKLLFDGGRYGQVLEEAALIEKQWNFSAAAPAGSAEARSWIVMRYLQGLSSVMLKRYQDAAAILSVLGKPILESEGLSVIAPSAKFYEGWARYRLGSYREAYPAFAEVAGVESELSLRAAYLAGWCAYLTGEFTKAEQHFLASSLSGTRTDADRGKLMYAKSLQAQKKYGEAAAIYASLSMGSPPSPFGDDAMFEHAGLLAAAGKAEDAAALYRRLRDRFPDSPLCEEGLFRRGEVLYSAGLFIKARDAYYDYRTAYERGRYVDASLYWGGMASFSAKEEYGAILVWEKLVERYRESPFRPDAMRRIAEFYRKTGDFGKALQFYTELIALYPEDAAAASADVEAEKLRFLLLGQSDLEAELSVIISRERGLATTRGRQATLDLARVYLYKEGSPQDLAFTMLQDLVRKKDVDPVVAANAQYLIGEFFFRRGDYPRAELEFIAAAVVNPTDQDLMAASIYRAAEMAKLAGNLADAMSLVKRIEDNFPQSQWAAEGRKLVGSAPAAEGRQ
jgi:TolA-binding protein